MVIIIGNQKGGAGKSTFTLLLANYLTQIRGCMVTVIDMDYQQSLVQKFNKDQLSGLDPPYQVIAASLEQYPVMLKVLGENPEDLVLIDLPGKLDDDGLIPVFQSADQVYCPFGYDEFSFESTVLFAFVLQKINPDAELTFIPNRVKANVKYETQEEVDRQLAGFGKLSMPIPDRIDFQRVSTLRTPVAAFSAAEGMLDQLFYANMAFLLEDLSFQRLKAAGDE
ncbi:MAG TPA: ParA family protein [Pedobacter sp.]|nr:ParA family protein [Pedobacter sp.]